MARLSRLDRFLPLWIALAMAGGLMLGSLVPSLNDWLEKLQVGTVSVPIAVGLLLMMYPVLAKVRYEDIGKKQGDGVSDARFFGVSLFLSWVVGPLLMFAFAWLFLADQPAYRTGVIIVGSRAVSRWCWSGTTSLWVTASGRRCWSSSTRSSSSSPTPCWATST